MNRFEATMKHDTEYKLKCAFARHQQYLWTHIRSIDMELHTLGTVDEKPQWYYDMKGDAIEKKMDSIQAQIEYIKKNEHLGSFFALFVEYLYENILVLQGEDEDSTPYNFEESFLDWSVMHEYWPRRLPKTYRPDIHEGSLDQGEVVEILAQRAEPGHEYDELRGIKKQ